MKRFLAWSNFSRHFKLAVLIAKAIFLGAWLTDGRCFALSEIGVVQFVTTDAPAVAGEIIV